MGRRWVRWAEGSGFASRTSTKQQYEPGSSPVPAELDRMRSRSAPNTRLDFSSASATASCAVST